MTDAPILLDEHVGRVFERVLRERGYRVHQAKDRFGEHTVDAELLRWCGDHGALLISNNAKDFEALDKQIEHAGILLVYEQRLPDDDPEGLARTVDEVLDQYGIEGVKNQVVDLSEWYDWLHE